MNNPAKRLVERPAWERRSIARLLGEVPPYRPETDKPEDAPVLDRLFKRFVRKPGGINLDIGGKPLTFNSVRDFEFALASRTDVPATKIAQLMRLKDDELLAEIEGIRDVKRKFVSVLLRSITKDDSISHSLRMLDATLFSNDHQWRQFIAALNADTGIHDAFKRVALVKYLQYLNSRHDVVRTIYRDRHSADQDPIPASFDDSGKFVQFASVDAGGRLSSKAASGEITRLPKGERIPLTVREGDEVYLFLSSQQYKLKRGATLTLIDESGREQILHAGRNVIGRGSDADVRVGGDKKDVSRRHLVIELPDDEMALLTDISSGGTFVEDKALKGK